MHDSNRPTPKGRGAAFNPPNRFESTCQEQDFEQVAHDDEYLASLADSKTEYLPDNSKTIVSENDSPDIQFRFSLNPYRGCSHGCSYCYARPTHEYLGLSAGLDFETKILFKHDAAILFRDFLNRPRWKPEPIVLSGVTDPYQPCEREFKITRECLEVALEAREPIDLITKNALILRDVDILKQMSEMRIIHIAVSITTLNADLARTMEPRTSTPTARLNAVRALADAGIPVRVMMAPIAPGLNDVEIPSILKAVADAGARAAGYVMLRLPGAVEPVFMTWVEQFRPTSKDRIVAAIRAIRGGSLSSSKFGDRMKGTGIMAEQIAQLFQTFAKKHGLDRSLPPSDCSQFRKPINSSGQRKLFS